VIATLTAKVTETDAVALTIEAQIADEEAQIAIDEVTWAIDDLNYQLEQYAGWIQEVDVYISMSYDEGEIEMLNSQMEDLIAERTEVESLLADQQEAFDEIMGAKAQAEEAQLIAADLALGTPEALQRVLISAQAAFDKASVDLAAALTKADGLNTQVADIDSQINFMSAKEIDTSTEQGRKQTIKME